MPFFTITTSFSLSQKEKENVMSIVTKLTCENLRVAPDKVQVVLQDREQSAFSRSGVLLNQRSFSSDSRRIDINTKETYHQGTIESEEMVVIELDIWQNFSVDEKTILGEDITNFMKSEYILNGDNILILIRDMEPANWIQNGISGNNKEFLVESRKQ